MADERLTQDTLKFKHLLKQDRGAGRAVLAVPGVADQSHGGCGSDLPGQQVCGEPYSLKGRVLCRLQAPACVLLAPKLSPTLLVNLNLLGTKGLRN